jgi:hypothetical protein
MATVLAVVVAFDDDDDVVVMYCRRVPMRDSTLQNEISPIAIHAPKLALNKIKIATFVDVTSCCGASNVNIKDSGDEDDDDNNGK